MFPYDVLMETIPNYTKLQLQIKYYEHFFDKSKKVKNYECEKSASLFLKTPWKHHIFISPAHR